MDDRMDWWRVAELAEVVGLGEQVVLQELHEGVQRAWWIEEGADALKVQSPNVCWQVSGVERKPESEDSDFSWSTTKNSITTASGAQEEKKKP